MAIKVETDKDKNLATVIADIRRPLILAARHNFSTLSRIKGINRPVASIIRSLDDSKLTKAIRGKLDGIESLLADFDDLTEKNRKTAILKVIKILDSLQTIASKKKTTASKKIYGDTDSELNKSVQYLKGVGPKVAEFMATKNLITIEDLLYYLPRRYEDRRKIGNIKDLLPGEFGQAVGTIAAMSITATRFSKRPFEVMVQDESGTCTLLWFHYGAQTIAKNYQVGDKIRFGGKVSLFRNRKQIAHPDIALLSDDEDEGNELSGNIRPIYPEIQGINSKKLHQIMQRAVKENSSFLNDPLPNEILDKAELPSLSETIAELHTPADDCEIDSLNEGVSPFHKRLSFDELFFMQIAFARKRQGVKASKGYAHQRLSGLATRFYKHFPFKLTDAQRRVTAEIVDDLISDKPMNRLLQGDVGSGKTIVAVLAALLVIENGRQVALMAPTEILAEQHYLTVADILAEEGVKVELLKGDIKKSEKEKIYQRIESGETDFAIGTHALIQKGVNFKDLGCVIVDEQHRFGVEQRTLLSQKGIRPDCLVMTATPIPRSLSLTLYGDLDVSIIDELPKGRQPITTEILWMSENKQLEKHLLDELYKGRQAYVITPLVTESEKLDLSDAETEQAYFSAKLPDFSVGLLHGRMSGSDKEDVMRRFKNKEFDVLVSTSVVEVGVDVPNATMMIVKHAERFGLSQLHQLRGRVGRGVHPSYCYLMCEKVGEEARERLSIMEQTTDGFKIAEKDLEIRGPGDFLGVRQVGVPVLQYANLLRDQSLLQIARDLAFELIENDSNLSESSSLPIKREFLNRYQDRLKLIGIG